MPPKKKKNTKIELKQGGKLVDDKFFIPKGTEGATIDNQITNAKVNSGELPEARREMTPQGSVSASDLAKPSVTAKFTPPVEPTIPSRTQGLVNNVLGSIRSDSANARELAKQQAEFQTFAQDSSGFDIQNQQLERFGVTPEKLAKLENIEQQLVDRSANSEITKTRIAQGNSYSQAGRELTQEDREEAVRSAALSASAAVLRGNIELGRQLASDAVDIALQDRSFKANAMIQQINDLKDVTNEETRQLLEQEQRQYEEQLAFDEGVKKAVVDAMTSGGATDEEARQLNAPLPTNADPIKQEQLQRAALEQRQSLANQIIARTATSDRNLSRAVTNQQLNNAILSGQKTQMEIDAINSEYNGEFTALIDGASGLVGAERGKTSRKAIANALAGGDYTTAYALTANNVEESLTGDTKTKFANARTDYNVMEGMKNAIQAYQDAGGDTGLLTGKSEEISRKLLGVSGDPELTKLAIQLEREFQSYRQNMTGAAFSPSESREYASVNPRSTASLDLNLATIEGAQNQLENRITSTINTRVPQAADLFDVIQGTQITDPETAEIGEEFEIDGKLYRKIGEDQYQEI